MKTAEDFSQSLILHALKHHQYVFLDYEGGLFLWRPSDIEKILQSRNGQHGTLIVTLAARGREFSHNPTLLSEYAVLTEQYSQLGICVVAGHPAYPSVDRSLSSQKHLLRMIRRLRGTTSVPLLLGTEKLPRKFAASLAKEFSLIPFLLKSEALSQEITGYRNVLPDNRHYAVYSPISLVDDVSTILKKLVGYILRRETTIGQLQKNNIQPEEVKRKIEVGRKLSKHTQAILSSRLRELAIFGSNIEQQLDHLYQLGATILIGFPSAYENIFETITEIGHIYRVFGERCAHNSSCAEEERIEQETASILMPATNTG
ncbi:MAG: DUF7388 family protein [Candidatus Hodarchaeales archaeon]|jgi:hypothetical protein